MSSAVAVGLWLTAQALFLALPLTVVARVRRDLPRWEIGSVGVSLVANLPALFTLGLFLWVFVLGGASITTDVTGVEQPMYLAWWEGCWRPLLMVTPVALFLAVTGAAMPPYPPGAWGSFLCRMAGAYSAWMAWDIVMAHIPGS